MDCNLKMQKMPHADKGLLPLDIVVSFFVILRVEALWLKSIELRF